MINFKNWLESDEKQVGTFNDLLKNLPQVYGTDPKTNKPLTPAQTWKMTQEDPKYKASLANMKKSGIPLQPDPFAIQNMIKQQQSKKTAAPAVGTIGTAK